MDVVAINSSLVVVCLLIAWVTDQYQILSRVLFSPYIIFFLNARIAKSSVSLMDTSLLLLFIGLVLCYAIYAHNIRSSLAPLRGPEPASFLLGSISELYQEQAGVTDFKWQRLYGDFVRFKSILGEDQLFIADPNALHHILNASQSIYPSPPERRVVSGFINGKGIHWALGDEHRKQKRTMAAAFGVSHMDSFLRISRTYAEAMCNKWMETIDDTKGAPTLFNVYPWVSSATLDVIGNAAFGVHFGCLENPNHILVQSYRNMIASVLGSPSAGQIFFQELSKYIPPFFMEYLCEHSSDPRCVLVRAIRETVVGVSQELVKKREESLRLGEHYDDALGLLVKAGMDNDQKKEELLANMRTLLVGGHETTSHTIEWALLELARRPNIQSRLRAEVREKEAAVRARGDSSFTIADFSAMPYTLAVLKEVLRYHCVLPLVYRVAAQDDIIPLSRSITTLSGQVISEVTVPKGTRIVVSVSAYNRNTDLWGEDAQEFNPDRWTRRDLGKEGGKVGLYENMLTFLGGQKACVGWRLAIIETQAFLVEIINRFECSLSEKATRIRRESCGIVAPTVEGEVDKGVQMPLIISLAP